MAQQKVQGIDCPCRWEKVGQTNPRGSEEYKLAQKDQQKMPSTEVVGLEGGCPRGTENLKSNLSSISSQGQTNKEQLKQHTECKDYYQGEIQIFIEGQYGGDNELRTQTSRDGGLGRNKFRPPYLLGGFLDPPGASVHWGSWGSSSFLPEHHPTETNWWRHRVPGMQAGDPKHTHTWP